MFIERPTNRGLLEPRKGVCGVGINDAPYVVKYTDDLGESQQCPYFNIWRGMLERCFSSAFHKRKPTYIGCTVDESWKTFSIFKRWMLQQDWQGKHLDKDLISWDNKHYGPDTCLFISPALNNLLTLRPNGRGAHPLGVYHTTINGYGYYSAACSFYGKQKRLGYFKTSEEAAECYRLAKLGYIAELAAAEPNPRIKQALLNLH